MYVDCCPYYSQISQANRIEQHMVMNKAELAHAKLREVWKCNFNDAEVADTKR